MSIRTIYLFYFPRVKEPFSDKESPAYGRWCPKSFCDIGQFRSIEELYKKLEFENNQLYFGDEYQLINGLPKNEGLDKYTYEIMFRGARQLSIRKFNKLIKLKSKKGDLNLNKTRNRTKS